MSSAPRAVRGILRSRVRPSYCPSLPAAVQISHTPLFHRSFHNTQGQNVGNKPTTLDPRKNAATEILPPKETNFGKAQFADFNLKGRAFIVTGGAQGLGLSLAEALAEAGGKGKMLVLFSIGK